MAVVNTPTSTLAINPAFLQEIKDSNPDLWDTIAKLRQTCQCDDEPVKVSRNLTRMLDQLRDQLALQFSLEESYGFVTVPSSNQLSTQNEVLGELAMRAHRQHGTLYLRLSELAEQAEELQYRGVEVHQLHCLVEATQQFDTELREHERGEAELIERTYGFDSQRPLPGSTFQ